MSNEEDWIEERLGEVKKICPLVTDETSTRMRELLNGQVSERQLTVKELVQIAKALIADMATVGSAEGEGKP